MILSFTPWANIIPAYMETNQCTCHNVISCAICHASVATQKSVTVLCLYQLQLMQLQMHVHTSIKDFLAT